MKFDFDQFSHILEKKKVEIVGDEYEQNYILMVLINRLPFREINFDAFDEHDIGDVYSNLEEAITDENVDGEIALDPNHSYTRMMQLGCKISELQDCPKERVPSPYMFL